MNKKKQNLKFIINLFLSKERKKQIAKNEHNKKFFNNLKIVLKNKSNESTGTKNY